MNKFSNTKRNKKKNHSRLTRKRTTNINLKKGGMMKVSKYMQESQPTIKGAILSADQVYRYRLERLWDETKPKVLFIMLNPSTADGLEDDPTIRRVVNFAKSWGYGGVYVVNLYAFRSTDPKGLKLVADPIGPENREHIRALIDSVAVDRVIYAWGNKEKEPEWLRELITKPYCIAVSKKGIPKHPLYLKSVSQPILYLRDACQGQAATEERLQKYLYRKTNKQPGVKSGLNTKPICLLHETKC